MLTELKKESQQQQSVGENVEKIFLDCKDNVETKIQNFPKYVRSRHLKRFLCMYEIFKHVLQVKGSIVECGVYRGSGLMTWAKLSTILEPENTSRHIYGFDTFEGFPSVNPQDRTEFNNTQVGGLSSSSLDELCRLVTEFDADRWLGHIQKVDLIPGDMIKTIPSFLQKKPHLVVSLLVIDCDLYEPTKIALQNFVPLMPKGAVIVFDELDDPNWPGETRAVAELIGLPKLRLQRIPWGPSLAFAIIE